MRRRPLSLPLSLCLTGAALLSCSGKQGNVDDPGQTQDAGADLRRACLAVRSDAGVTRRPADIIVMVDNSASMTAAITAVQRNINENFASLLQRSGLDYRLILIAKHGTATVDQSICISPPLSQNETCSPPPPRPKNGPRFFHYDTRIDSTNALQRLLATYNQADPSGQAPGGWSEWVREGTSKTVILISDDNASLAAATFESRLLALLPARFGTAEVRGYVIHSIVGLLEKTPPTAPYLPAEALQLARCQAAGGAVTAGQEYQKLSISSGGLRFPICQHQSFDAVFQSVASGVLSASPVSCDFPVPAPPAGQQIDLATVVVEYTPTGAATPQRLSQVKAPAACAPGRFYVESDRIRLCPAACATVQSDGGARLEVLFDCAVIVS